MLPAVNPASTPNARASTFRQQQHDRRHDDRAPNTIANNNGPGVTVDTGTGDLISGNAIFNNIQGIVLQNSANDTLRFPTPTPPPWPRHPRRL